MKIKKTLLIVITIFLVLTSCGKKDETSIVGNFEDFSKGIEDFGKAMEEMTNGINDLMVEVEDNGESKACDVIKDDKIRKDCVNSCFPSVIFEGGEDLFNDDYKRNCVNGMIGRWAEKELSLSNCDYTEGDYEQKEASKYFCVAGVIEEKQKQGKSVSTADCTSLLDVKLYDACILLVATYNNSDSACDESKTEEDKSICKNIIILQNME